MRKYKGMYEVFTVFKNLRCLEKMEVYIQACHYSSYSIIVYLLKTFQRYIEIFKK